MVRRLSLITLLISHVFLINSCSVMRGIPTHGGGKRFDEEELAVAGAIRRTIADMDLKELSGKTVLVILDGISHSGGGYLTYPGISAVTGSVGSIRGQSLTDYARGVTNPLYYPYMDNDNNNHSDNWSLTASLNPNFSFNSAVFSTDPDMNYFRSALTMKIQHNGIISVPATPDYILYVLVDILGLNRSRRDSLVYWTDTLQASCEITYYAIDAKTNQMAFRARRNRAVGVYRETSLVGFMGYEVTRYIEAQRPSALPVDGDELTRLAPPDGVTTATLPAAPVKLPQARPERRKYDDLLINAELQLQVGNLNEAQRLVDTVRTAAPNHPGLDEIESKLQRRRQGH